MSLTNACLCVLLLVGASAIRPRRTDIKHKGHSDMFRGWVDVQGERERYIGVGLFSFWIFCFVILLSVLGVIFFH